MHQHFQSLIQDMKIMVLLLLLVNGGIRLEMMTGVGMVRMFDYMGCMESVTTDDVNPEGEHGGL